MIEKTKKIVFLVPTLSGGGGERVVSDLSLYLPINIERTIVLFENKVSYPYKGTLRYLNTPLSLNVFLRSIFFFIRIFRFRRLMKQEKPSWVISVGGSAAFINIFSGGRSIVRVDNFISKNFNGFFGALFKVGVKMFFSRATYIVAVSKGVKEDLIKNFGVQKDKIRVIYNPIALEKIQEQSKKPIAKQHESIFNNPVVIHMGRMSKEKGQWHLIRAFSILKKEIKDAKLVILGEGALQNHLESMIQDFGFENDVYLLGWQDNPYSYLARADVFVLSSLWEGLPDSILEALGCGLSVISSDCQSGPREILAPLTDFRIKTNNVEPTEYGMLVPVCDGKMHGADIPLTREEQIMGNSMIDILKDKNKLKMYKIKSLERAEDFNVRKTIKNWGFLNEI